MRKPNRPRIPKLPSLKAQAAISTKYNSAVGRVAANCTMVQEALAMIFSELATPEKNKRIAFSIWYSLTSDRGQQAMLSAVIKSNASARWPAFSTAKDDLAWLLKEAGRLLEARNNAIHAPTSMFLGGSRSGTAVITPLTWPGHPRAGNLIDKGDLVEEFTWVANWADVLTSFSRMIWNALLAPNGAWPDRPQRPTRGPRTIHPGPQRLRDLPK